MIIAQLIDSISKILTIYAYKEDEEKLVKTSRPFLLVFSSGRFLLEYLIISMEQFIRTWKEMHANPEDEERVLNVVKYQIALGIEQNFEEFYQFDEHLQKKLTYFHTQRIMERQQLEKDETEMQNSTIKILRQHLRVKFEDLAKLKKKNVLKKGYVFIKINKGKSNNQLWHWRLDENGQYLWFMDLLSGSTINSPKLDLKSKKKCEFRRRKY